MPVSAFRLLLCALLAALGAVCSRQAEAAEAPSAAGQQHAATPPSAVAALGRKIFFDPSLSASGRMSCATCHDPGHAYAPANRLAVQLGGPRLNRQGART